MFHKTRRSSSQQKVKKNGGVLCTITIRSVATKSLKLWAHIKTFSSGASLTNHDEQQKYGGNPRKLVGVCVVDVRTTLNSQF